MINIVLYEPEIPQNTGNIMRTCAGTYAKLHLIKPLGFSLDDRYLKRSGVNYIEHCDYTVYEDFEDFLNKNADGEFVDMNQQFGIYQFNNPSGLEKLSFSRLQVSEASGLPMLEGTNGTIPSKVCQYYLEGSNVQVADEMVNMIIAQRAYEMNSKAIQTADSMLQTANELKR